MDVDFIENLLPKDQLEKSNCCRFCAAGAYASPEMNVSFIQIYEENCMLKLNERLDNLINRYLPLKVYETDPHFPRLICSTCYYSLEETIQFFDKISIGQKILMKIINQNRIIESRSRKTLDYSEDNPLLQPPKRRGRPKKDPNKPKENKPPPFDILTLTPKPKRQSRPPVRYAADCTSELDVIKEEPIENETELENKWNSDGTDDFLTFQSTTIRNPDVSGSLESPGGFTELVVVRNTTLLDLEKLNIIMDGDEELEQIQPSVLKDDGGGLDEISAHTFLEQRLGIAGVMAEENSNAIGAGVTMAIGCGPAPSLPVLDDNPEVLFILDENVNDSDASVRTIDMIPNRRKKKRKVKRRKMKKGPIIKCPECDKEFRHSSSLVYHRAVVHDALPKKHICVVCGKGFSHRTLLTAHVYTHSEERCFKCDECILKFKSKASLYTHKKSVHCEKKQFTCDKCGGQFNLKSSLKNHMRLHTGEKPYVCEFCKKTFAQRSNMREHRRIHTGERPYKCAIPNCDKSFTTASQLRSHKLTHSGLKPFLCSICGKGFTHGENFKYHLRRHAGEKPLECPLCPKQFIEPWSLKKHWRFHTGEKPYVCLICKKEFADSSNYAKHKKLHQDGEECDTPCSTSSFRSEPSGLVQDQGVENESQYVENEVSLTEGDDLDSTYTARITEDGSIVRVLNTGDGMDTFDSVEGNQQFIYVYPDDLPIFTITLSDGQQAIEVRANDEGTLQALGNLAGGGPITLATVQSVDGQYYKLESYNRASTSLVPLTENEVNSGENIIASLEIEPGNESEALVSPNQTVEKIVTVLQIDEPQGSS